MTTTTSAPPVEEVLSVAHRLWKQVQTIPMPVADRKLLMLGLTKIRNAGEAIQAAQRPRAKAAAPAKPKAKPTTTPVRDPDAAAGSADLSDLNLGGA